MSNTRTNSFLPALSVSLHLKAFIRLAIYEIKCLYFSLELTNKIILEKATNNAGHISPKSLLENVKIRKEIVNGNNTI